VDVVRISDKDITLDSGGDGSQLTLDVMNDALEPYGFVVKPHPRDESWQVPAPLALAHSPYLPFLPSHSPATNTAPSPFPRRARSGARPRRSPSPPPFLPPYPSPPPPHPSRCRIARPRWCGCTTVSSSRAPHWSLHNLTLPSARDWAGAAGAGADGASAASIATRRTERAGASRSLAALLSHALTHARDLCAPDEPPPGAALERRIANAKTDECQHPSRW
jgi:hypothetical protein